MLTVWCVLWGDKYHPGYVYALRDAVAANLTAPHQFICITTQNLEGITTRNPPVSWHGWWQKLGLFAPQVGRQTGGNLYFDLDVVITGNLDYLIPYTNNAFSAPENWAQSGHGGVQSSVIAWNGGWHDPYKRFDYSIDSERLWGDQEFIWELLGDDFTRLPHIGSYKYHCRQGLPDDMRVIVFHGLPNPPDAQDDWLLPYTENLRGYLDDK